jgi:hypothetical protein
MAGAQQEILPDQVRKSLWLLRPVAMGIQVRAGRGKAKAAVTGRATVTRTAGKNGA